MGWSAVTEPYNKAFYDRLHAGVVRSAEVIVPIVLQLVPAQSVVDVGCGEGAWLGAFQRFGVPEIFGIDGDYIDGSALQIPRESFLAADLEKPLRLSRDFDLAVSLEVAEHLPEGAASSFIESLTRLAPAVLFSAAVPFQGGTHHVNEQWPEKWAEHFEHHGYMPVDAIRKRVWGNEAVAWWYAQNTLLFVRRDYIDRSAPLKEEFRCTSASQLCLVHPRKYLALQDQYTQALSRESYLRAHPASGVREALSVLRDCLTNSVRSRLERAHLDRSFRTAKAKR